MSAALLELRLGLREGSASVLKGCLQEVDARSKRLQPEGLRDHRTVGFVRCVRVVDARLVLDGG
jgi:hypothetical protein